MGHTHFSKLFHGNSTNDKESLAAYIHRFEWEAKRCNFHNNAAMIQIFIKGLKNAHTLASHVYKKGPQTLADAISEVEKLQAAQQLTATLLPSSTVNVMSSEDDKCFQCQEPGHMIHHCPHIQCFNCDEYGHITADSSDKIPPSGTLACHKKHHSHTRQCTRCTSRHCHRNRHRFSRSRSQSHTHGYWGHSCNNSHRSCSRSYHRWPHRSTSHHWHSSTYCYQCDTPHRRSSSHRSSSTHSRYCSKSRPHSSYRSSRTASSKPSSSSNKPTSKYQDRKYKRVTIDDPQSDYYSSDDASSDSDDDLN